MRTIFFLFAVLFSVAGYGQQQMLLRGEAPGGGLILDTNSASAAYSVRKLSNAYAGSSIRIRRASDNAETDIGFSGNYIDEAAIVTHCSGTNCFVTTWYDQSGNTRNATQSTAADQPKIYDSVNGVIRKNSLASLSWESNDRLNIPLSIYAANQAYTHLFVTYSLNANGNFPAIFQSAGSTDKGFIFLHRLASREQRVGTVRVGGVAVNNAPALVLGTLYLSDLSADRSIVNLYKNGVSELAIPDNNSDYDLSGVTGFFMGDVSLSASSGDFTGNVSEFIFFTNDISANAATIRTNINAYFSIY